MCGFVAAMPLNDNSQIQPEQVRAVLHSLEHRGKDASRFAMIDGVAMGHNRLSILDLESAPQPRVMRNLSMVYNGEIYNSAELQQELIKCGYAFTGHCDTDVFLAAFAEWGIDAFSRFNGMFAAVILDAGNDSVTVVRDRYGIKPLFVGEAANGVRLFSSEMMAMYSYPSIKRKLNFLAMDQLLRLGYVTDPMTLDSNIRQVSPGGYEIHRLGSDKITSGHYWRVSDAMQAPAESISGDRVAELLKSAVSQQMKADVSVGCFLSGGLDSGIVARLMSERLQFPQTLNGYIADFDMPDFSEAGDALKMISGHPIVGHTKCFGRELLQGAPLIASMFGAFGDNAALPTYHLAKLASNSDKVLLSGDGADELFFGYKNHRSMLFEQYLKKAFVGGLELQGGRRFVSRLAEIMPDNPHVPRVLRWRSTLRSLAEPLAVSYHDAMSISSREQLLCVYGEDLRQQTKHMTSEQFFAGLLRETDISDPMKIIQYLDFKTYLPGSVLTKLDRATMRAGVEARVPYLDNALVDAVLPQKSEQNLSLRNNKKLLRAAARTLGLSDLAVRPKRSFTSPLDLWIRQTPESYLLSQLEALGDNGFELNEVIRLFRNHQGGHKNHGNLLWTLFTLNAWLKQG